jgi:WD40 repeat protein
MNSTHEARSALKALLTAFERQSPSIRVHPHSAFTQILWESRRDPRSFAAIVPILDQRNKLLRDRGGDWLNPYPILDSSMSARPYPARTTGAIAFAILESEPVAAVVGTEGRVVLLNLETGEELGAIGLEAAYAVCFAGPDDPRLFVAGVSGGLYLLDMRTGKAVSQEMHNGEIMGLARSMDGRFIATCGGRDRRVKVLDAREATEYEIREDYFSFNDCAFSPTDDLLSVAAAGGNVFLHQPPDADAWRAIYSHESDAMVCAFSDSGVFLASGSYGGELVVWDLRRSSEVWRRPPHGCSVLAVTFYGENNLFCADAEGSVDQYEIDTGKHVRTLAQLPGAVNRIAIDRNTNQLLAAADRLWGMDLDPCSDRAGEQLGILLSIAPLPDGRVASAGELPGLALVTPNNDRAVTIRIIDSTSRISHVALSTQRGLLVTGSAASKRDSFAGRVELRNFEGEVAQVVLPGEHSHSSNAAVHASCLLRGDSVLVTALCSEPQQSGDPVDKLVLTDLVTGRQQSIGFNERCGPRCLAPLPGGLIAAGYSDGMVRIHIDTTLEIVGEYKRHEGIVWCCVHAPAFGGLVTGGYDGYLKVIDINTGSVVENLQQEIFSINSCALSSNGSLLASGSSTGAVRFWRDGDPDPFAVFFAGTFINVLGFSAAGDQLYFGGGRGLLGAIRVGGAQPRRE